MYGGRGVDVAVGIPVNVRLYELVEFWDSGDESEVWVLFCAVVAGEVLLPARVKLMETVPVGNGRVYLVDMSLSLLVTTIPVAPPVAD